MGKLNSPVPPLKRSGTTISPRTAGDTVALGTSNITMTGSIADTTNRVLKGWFTDLQATNAIAADITGTAADATVLETARTIGGVSFDGSANINLPGVNASGNQDTSGNAATATSATTATNLAGGSGGTVPYQSAAGTTAMLANGTAGQVLTSAGTTAAPTWETNGAGTVTSVAALTLGTTGTDVSSTVATGTTTPVITLQLPTASTTNRGLLSSANWDTFNGKAEANQTMYIGTTAVAINRGTAALTLAGITLTTPDIGTPSAGVLTNCSGTAASLTAGAVTGFTPASGSLTLAGADALTLSTIGATNVTLPSTGTLATLAGAEALTNKTIGTDGTPSTLTLSEKASIALDPAGGTDGDYSGITITGTGGETIAVGETVYLKAADSEWYLTDADADATAGAVLVGIAVTTSTDGNPITVMTYGQIRADAKFPALTIGAPVYLGVTAGAIQVAAPSGDADVVRVVGHALTADEILFNPSPDWIVVTA